MDEKTLRTIEYPKVLNKLKAYTTFAYSQELAEYLLPSANIHEVQDLLNETTEAKDVLRLYPMFTLGGIRDIRNALHHANIGGTLDIESLVNVADTCRSIRLTKVFLGELKGNFPLLIAMGNNLGLFKTIESAVEKAITPEGNVSDNASAKLFQTRRKIKLVNDRIKERLNSLIHNGATAKYLQEPIVTIRADRYVVPVKQEYRSQIPGIVHDMSASGGTLFIEPMAVMESNNELQKLFHEEEDEVDAILRALTAVILNFYEDLGNSLDLMAKIDLIFAKAKLSIEMDGCCPKLNNKGQINLMEARHPLIKAEQVVPINIKITSDVYSMVITGPNTGGKTVTLKTVGLLTLMALSGLHIPAKHGSELCFYKQIYADIGDEQSIEQSLSTFSSHMVNIVEILAKADAQTLVLVDELGAGTDPTEGAALAMSILSFLKDHQAKVIATTHYSELKAFAYNNPGYINASVEFDVQTLRPTYKLLMGVPGKSNAFQIAKRLGMKDGIIETATSFMTKEDMQVADLIANLEAERLGAALERDKAEQAYQRILAKEAQLQDEEEKAQIKVAGMIRNAHEESRHIIAETQKRSETLYQELAEKMKNVQEADKAWQEGKQALKKMAAANEETQPEMVYAGKAPTTVQPGEAVHIPKLNQHGYALTAPNSSGDVQVQIGILKMMIALKDLRLEAVKDKGKKGVVRSNGLQRQKSLAVANELDLRGFDSLSGIEAVDKYLDDAFMAGLKEVRIIHGKGTGVLRAAITDYLKSHRLVKSFRLGDYNTGGNGVTVVELDI